MIDLLQKQSRSGLDFLYVGSYRATPTVRHGAKLFPRPEIIESTSLISKKGPPFEKVALVNDNRAIDLSRKLGELLQTAIGRLACQTPKSLFIPLQIVTVVNDLNKVAARSFSTCVDLIQKLDKLQTFAAAVTVTLLTAMELVLKGKMPIPLAFVPIWRFQAKGDFEYFEPAVVHRIPMALVLENLHRFELIDRMASVASNFAGHPSLPHQDAVCCFPERHFGPARKNSADCRLREAERRQVLAQAKLVQFATGTGP
mmetsp:Transcript_25670/g.74229  ORF Transcript_25670/g.74229 Transcript_25670/m.74229 type:complete len:257 (+) Transcript_25670:320-1090(+)